MVGLSSSLRVSTQVRQSCLVCEYISIISFRPVEWSNSSVIFTAHALQPLIIARHFSSSRQFNLPFPAPISSNLNTYDPPTIITCSPDDRWLFAFFPGRGEDGLCCLWHRGVELDSWSVKEWWLFAQSAGVVAARWLGGPREVSNCFHLQYF